jgi:hypothetical protein
MEHFHHRHAVLASKVITSDRLPINFTARTPQGAVWSPHTHLWSKPEEERSALSISLANCLETEQCFHLLRFYSAAALAELVPEGMEASGDILSHSGHRRLALQLLRSGCIGARGPATPCAASASPEVGELCLKHAQRWPGATLVIQNPDQYRESEICKLVGEINLEKLITDRAARIRQAQKPVVAFDEETNRRTRVDPYSQVDADLELAWPASAVINSLDHLRRFGLKKEAANFPKKSAVKVSDEVLEQSNVDLVKALVAGAAVLGSRKLGDEVFEFEALAAADSRSVSHVVADLHILYGTNLPIDRVALRDGDAQVDASALQQLCGRVGRSGKGFQAEVVLPEASMRLAVSTELGSREVAAERLCRAFRVSLQAAA